MKTYTKPKIQKMYVRSYINHMCKNLYIAVHMAWAAIEHAVHAILPFTNMKHKCEK